MKRNYGEFGGQYAAETLLPALEELEQEFEKVLLDQSFWQEYEAYCKDFIGRQTPITHLKRLSDAVGGAKIYAKREDLCHTGAHKINNAIGQALLAKRLGKRRIVAETGAGQHGVATAAACANLGLECIVYMGAKDAIRQAPNAQRMKLFGADLRLVEQGSATLKDAINEAIRDWITNVDSTHYLIGSAIGPFPFPEIVRKFQSVIGEEAKKQIFDTHGRLPDAVVACVGGGSNAIGIFAPFIEEKEVRLVGVQAGGSGSSSGEHSTPLLRGKVGVLHGAKTMLLQDADGQILPTHSLAPGLDYPGVGPEHSALLAEGRAEYMEQNDSQAIEAFKMTCKLEGILPALETAHAIAAAMELAKAMKPDQAVLLNLSGRGDKDLTMAMEYIAAQN